jgi:hypothetical protein
MMPLMESLVHHQLLSGHPLPLVVLALVLLIPTLLRALLTVTGCNSKRLGVPAVILVLPRWCLTTQGTARAHMALLPFAGTGWHMRPPFHGEQLSMLSRSIMKTCYCNLPSGQWTNTNEEQLHMAA